MLAHEPGFLSGQMLVALVPDPLRRTIGDTHPDGREVSLKLPFGAGAPTDALPFGLGQHVFSRYRQSVWNVPLTGAATRSNRPNHLHIRGVDLEVTRNADGPGEFASCQPLAERPTHSVARIRQHAAKTHTGSNHTIEFSQSNLRLRPCN